MIAICIDDEPILVNWLYKMVTASADITHAEKFTDETKALAYASENSFDIAFIDIELHMVDGITIGELLREINPNCGIVFCTGHANYAVDAINKLSVNGYVLKPIKETDIQREIDRFKKQYKKNNPLLTIDLCGGINIFDRDGNPVSFKRSKTEQLVAILAMHDGQGISTRELCELLWKDSVKSQYLYEKNENYLTQLLTDLRHTLTKCNASSVLKKTTNGYALRTPLVIVKKDNLASTTN